MTKLKTLKDLMKELASEKSIDSRYCVMRDLLREEAIKWVKANEKGETNTPEELVFKSGYCQGLIDFHNITEDDLI